jgi:hypothetical protein
MPLREIDGKKLKAKSLTDALFLVNKCPAFVAAK